MKIYITTNANIGKKCKKWALEKKINGIEIVNNKNECEIFFSIFYDKILNESFIKSKIKCFNFHAGILPKYRGSGTINWAIINKEKYTGVTLHEIDEKIDNGRVINFKKIKITKKDTAESLYIKSENLIFITFKKMFKDLCFRNYSLFPKSNIKGNLFTRKKLKMAKNLTNYVKAFKFFDKENAYFINRKGKKIYLKFD